MRDANDKRDFLIGWLRSERQDFENLAAHILGLPFTRLVWSQHEPKRRLALNARADLRKRLHVRVSAPLAAITIVGAAMFQEIGKIIRLVVI